jgi:hypothetical protein
VVVHTPDRHYEADQLSVDDQYFETMGLEITDGRAFNPNFESDKLTAVVNEAFVTSTGLQEPVGSHFKIDTVQFEIIGVVSDFHSYSFDNRVNPTIFRLAGAEQDAYLSLQNQWAELFPEIPFQGGYQEDVWGNYFAELGIYSRVWHVFAFIVVLLASLGVYGLMTLNVAGRIREFSIRKVLGATLQKATSLSVGCSRLPSLTTCPSTISALFRRLSFCYWFCLFRWRFRCVILANSIR